MGFGPVEQSERKALC